MIEVPATEFATHFGRYQELAQRESVAITSHGRTTGYFMSDPNMSRSAFESTGAARVPDKRAP